MSAVARSRNGALQALDCAALPAPGEPGSKRAGCLADMVLLMTHAHKGTAHSMHASPS